MLYQYKVTGSRHPVIGIPLLGRRGRAEREVFGTFTNTMPFSCAVDSGQTLAAYIASVADRLQLCLLHQKYPYDLLKKALAEEGAAAYSFDVCINCYNTVLRDPLGGLPPKRRKFSAVSRNMPCRSYCADGPRDWYRWISTIGWTSTTTVESTTFTSG